MKKLLLVLAMPFLLAVAACDTPTEGGDGGGAAPAEPMTTPEP